MLRCLGEHEIIQVLAEIHKGAYNSHIGGKALTENLLRGNIIHSMTSPCTFY